MITRFQAVIVAGLFVSGLADELLALDYNNGLENTHDTVASFVNVYDSRTAIPTTLHVVEPSDISFLTVNDSSFADHTGGTISFVTTHDNSHFLLNGGVVAHVQAADSSRAVIQSGSTSHARAYDEAVVEFLGGSATSAGAHGVNPSGAPDNTAYAHSQLIVREGLIEVVTARRGGTANVYGGDLGTFFADIGGTGNIHGGEFVTIRSFTDSVTNFYVRNYDLTFLANTPDFQRFSLTGMLENGDPLNAAYEQWSGAEVNFITVPEPSRVVARQLFYNNSKFDGRDVGPNQSDDNSIGTDKTALLPGEPSTFANYSSYSAGINGVMLDVENLPGTPTSADFSFRVGNSSDLTSWSVAPSPASVTVRAGEGVEGSDRITILWGDGAIRNQWLEISLLPTLATGLTSADTFYFGNAVGESGNVAGDYSVSITDELLARNNPAGVAPGALITNRFDYNRDGTVSVIDQLLSRNNITTALSKLQVITVPNSLAANPLSTVPEPSTLCSVAAGALTWLTMRGVKSGQASFARQRDLSSGQIASSG